MHRSNNNRLLLRRPMEMGGYFAGRIRRASIMVGGRMVVRLVSLLLVLFSSGCEKRAILYMKGVQQYTPGWLFGKGAVCLVITGSSFISCWCAARSILAGRFLGWNSFCARFATYLIFIDESDLLLQCTHFFWLVELCTISLLGEELAIIRWRSSLCLLVSVVCLGVQVAGVFFSSRWNPCFWFNWVKYV
jgi:hypothetical protein